MKSSHIKPEKPNWHLSWLTSKGHKLAVLLRLRKKRDWPIGFLRYKKASIFLTPFCFFYISLS